MNLEKVDLLKRRLNPSKGVERNYDNSLFGPSYYKNKGKESNAHENDANGSNAYNGVKEASGDNDEGYQ